MDKISILAEGLTSPVTIKDFLKKHGFSVSLIKEVKFGGIFLSGKSVTVRAIVQNGDTVDILLPDEVSESIEPMNIPLRILYEDEYIIAVDKPTNMPIHPAKGNHLPTLANAVMGYFGGKFVFRAINRLDRDTSGIVIVAKDRITAFKLSETMKAGRFIKKYKALITGIPDPSEGLIDAPIRREGEASIKRGVFDDGKRAVTEYKVVGQKDGNALCEILLHTGRTHQIRVHMAYIGHPLYGDFLYGTRNEDGYFLRCDEIEFEHPVSGDKIKILA